MWVSSTFQSQSKVVFHVFLRLYNYLWWDGKSDTSYFGIVKTYISFKAKLQNHLSPYLKFKLKNTVKRLLKKWVLIVLFHEKRSSFRNVKYVLGVVVMLSDDVWKSHSMHGH